MDIDCLITHVKSEDVYEYITRDVETKYCHLFGKYCKESKGHKKMHNKKRIKIEDYKNYLENGKIMLKPKKGLQIKPTNHSPKILIRF